ncbi:MAG: hypothetical protein V4667_00600 [Bacteroidota bacterium]
MKQLVLLSIILLCCISAKAQRKSFQIDSVYTIAVKDTFCLTEANFCWVFNYHSHKNYADKNESVLICDFTCIKNNVAENKHLVFDGEPPYTWKYDNYLFTILEYDYDTFMKVRTSIVRE